MSPWLHLYHCHCCPNHHHSCFSCRNHLLTHVSAVSLSSPGHTRQVRGRYFSCKSDRVAAWRKPSLASPRPNHHKVLYNPGSAQTYLTSLCFHQRCCSDHVPHCPCPGLSRLLFPPLGLSWLLSVRQDSVPWSPPLRAVQHPIPGSTMASVNPAARISSISDVISFICLFIMCSLPV